MKLLKRKPKDFSILERELQLESEDEIARERGLKVRLCDTRLGYVARHAFRNVTYCLGNSEEKNGIIFLPATILISFVASFFEIHKDSVTGKYIFRYED
jgi:hypothetical protein